MIGVGLMLLSLTLLRESVQPLTHSEALPAILAPLKTDAIIAIVMAALITWFMHSSLAAVLFFASLAASPAIDMELGFHLILGANLGGAFIPYILLLKDKNPAVRRITIGNLIMRSSVIFLMLPFTQIIITYLQILEPDMSTSLVYAHMAFNIVLALIFIPLVQVLALLCKKVVPDQPRGDDPDAPQYLDEKSLDTPLVALGCAARETLRVAEYVEGMLDRTIEAFKKDDMKLVKNIKKTDDVVDRLYNEIKLYMTSLSRESLDGKEADRYVQILTFSTNLEYVGDIIDKNLMELAEKKIKKHESFSPEGLAELEHFHKAVLENMQLAQNIFLLQDPDLARQMVDEKKTMRKAVKKSTDQHFQRLTDGKASSLATSSLHMDILRDYRRINTYMTAVAYNILDQEKANDKKKKKVEKAKTQSMA